MKISANFSLDELTASQTAARRKIDNTPTEEHIANLKRLCTLLEKVREVIGRPIIITSGYRSPALNSAVGGAHTSQHCFGCAADFKVHGLKPDEVVRAILTADLAFDQLIVENGWTHISVPNLAARPYRKQVLIIDENGTRPYPKNVASLVLKPKTMKPLKKSKTVKASTAAISTGTITAGAGAIAAAAPAVPVISDITATVQENPSGALMVAGAAILAFGGYILWRRIDDARKS